MEVHLRIHEQLKGQWRRSALTQLERRDSREIGTGTLPTDRDLTIIDPELTGVFEHILRRRVRIVDGRGKRMLRREPVVDRHDDASGEMREIPAWPIGRIERAEDEAATVKVDQARQLAARRRRVDANRDLTGGPWHRAIHHAVQRPLGTGELRWQRQSARFGGCHLVHRPAAHRRELIQECLALRM